MVGKPRYNWNSIRDAYISGDMNLIDLAKESTGRASDPPYQSIRRAAVTDSMGKWEDLRQAYRNTVATQIAPLLTLELILNLAFSRKLYHRMTGRHPTDQSLHLISRTH